MTCGAKCELENRIQSSGSNGNLSQGSKVWEIDMHHWRLNYCKNFTTNWFFTKVNTDNGGLFHHCSYFLKNNHYELQVGLYWVVFQFCILVEYCLLGLGKQWIYFGLHSHSFIGENIEDEARHYLSNLGLFWRPLLLASMSPSLSLQVSAGLSHHDALVLQTVPPARCTNWVNPAIGQMWAQLVKTTSKGIFWCDMDKTDKD